MMDGVKITNIQIIVSEVKRKKQDKIFEKKNEDTFQRIKGQ